MRQNSSRTQSIERGVIGDYRAPSVIRFELTPLYTSFMDVWNAVDTLRVILDGKKYKVDLVLNVVT